jgi:hypothetical protein
MIGAGIVIGFMACVVVVFFCWVFYSALDEFVERRINKACQEMLQDRMEAMQFHLKNHHRNKAKP